ncbi:hypothetical protein [Fortiea contorta]|uniref:hypothetical protein n=1 Tax=Fortiea contorta TaxID=1892405 RepID=UPI0012B52BE4|nr:hypothetical protein [Fortiea contorta]
MSTTKMEEETLQQHQIHQAWETSLMLCDLLANLHKSPTWGNLIEAKSALALLSQQIKNLAI